ncbi:sodium:solute symporter [Actinobacteria bacterium YIM 96077]|uniref:Sodium:solute symporter n=1 Tax=Phytoactinopolyspora halophila TaxID=1981511 RepID=A0A329QRT0_9ACTN|nr:sodium/solute symporter [Phytoactinopolyspora halophila]AYY14541.1 sodium:solute symporter [Actinobacteria bacterium YIM 96077]RAW14082.1 sodium:solute symporter [Phytoactinopolyspora halophila]
MEDVNVATVDLLVVVAYVVGILIVGFWVGRGHETTDGYFLAGRRAVWPLIGFGLIAVNLSGTSYVGVAGAGYEEGVAVWNYEWMAALVLAFFALFILPFYLQTKISTAPEFLRKRYDRRSQTVFSVFTVFTAMFIDASGAMFAGAITLAVLFPEIPLGVLIVGMALLGGIYVIMGGLRAVEITDTVQGILLLIAGGVLFFLVFNEIGGSWTDIESAAPEGGMTIAPESGNDFLPWPGIFTGVVWLGFYYWTTNHIAVQKILSARSVNHGRFGALFAGLMQLPLLFLLVMPGLMGRELYGDIDSPDQIWQMLVVDFLPTGVRGLVLAALVAALMSTLDSVLNGAASLVTNDMIKVRWPRMSERRLLVLGRLMVGVFMIVAAVWAPQIAEFPTIVEYFQSFLGAITMPVVVVFLGGIFWHRATAPASFITLVIGFPVGLAAFIANEIVGVIDIQFLYLTGLMLAFSIAIFVSVTVATEPPPREHIRDVIWSRATMRQETHDLREVPLWRNHRVYAVGLIIVTLLSLIPFL